MATPRIAGQTCYRNNDLAILPVKIVVVWTVVLLMNLFFFKYSERSQGQDFPLS